MLFLSPLHLSLAPLGNAFGALRVAEVKRWCGKVLKVFTSYCKQFLKLSRLLTSDKLRHRERGFKVNLGRRNDQERGGTGFPACDGTGKPVPPLSLSFSLSLRCDAGGYLLSLLATECARVARERKGVRGENECPPEHPGARSPRLPRSGNSAIFALPRIEQKKSTLLSGQIGKKGLTSPARGCMIKQKTQMRVKR